MAPYLALHWAARTRTQENTVKRTPTHVIRDLGYGKVALAIQTPCGLAADPLHGVSVTVFQYRPLALPLTLCPVFP